VGKGNWCIQKRNAFPNPVSDRLALKKRRLGPNERVFQHNAGNSSGVLRAKDLEVPPNLHSNFELLSLEEAGTTNVYRLKRLDFKVRLWFGPDY
jgi:hypothetical protein